MALALALLAVLAIAGGVAGQAEPAGSGSRYIVIFEEHVSQAARDALVRRFGEPVKDLRLVQGKVVLLPHPQAAEALRAQPGVRRVEPDALAFTQAEVLPWGVDRIDADRTWGSQGGTAVTQPGLCGSGVKVAVLDTGIDLRHPDLQANIKGGYNAINPKKTPNDDNGHGTHVAGIVAAVDNTVGVLGTAPCAWLYAVKVLGANGSGWVSDIIEGIEWSIQNGMHIVNMSFGTSSDVQSFHDALIKAYQAGILLVAAAGNSGPSDNTVLYPARYPEVIAVSATDTSDQIANFSSRGPEVELAAPGVNIFSTYRGGKYATASGTSMAAPHVTGAAALAWGSGQVTDVNGDGRLNDDVRARLQATADDLGAPGRDNLYGYGLVDAQEAATGVQVLP